MNLRDLKLRIRSLIAPRAVEQELDEELAFHIECETKKIMAEGVSEARARQRARARFGPVPLAADQCRDERGISFLEMLGRDIRFAMRMLRRTPLVALTVISTIALGLGVVTVAFTFFNMFFFRIDAVRNPQELYEVERRTGPGGDDEIWFTRPEYEALRRETSVFVDVAAARTSVATRIDGRAVRGMFVSSNYFEMLGASAERGRTLTQADHARGSHPVVVLSHFGWEKLFAADPAVIGRKFLLNGHPYEVAGVMPEDFRGLHLEPQDYWAPLELIGQFRDLSKSEVSVDVIGRLKPGTSVEAAAAALTSWATAQPRSRNAESGANPPNPTNDVIHILLREKQGVMVKDRGEAMAAFIPILFAFGLILMIGCANVANLLLARGLSRQREIGVRLSLGATRQRIVRQLLTENLLLALAAGGLGYFVSRGLLGGSIYMAWNILPPEFTETMDVVIPPGDWRVFAFLFGGALVATLMFGLAPALHSTRVELVRAMRGEVTKDARPNRVRHWLIGIQITASALLLVCAAVFLRSTYSASTKDIGIQASDTVVVGGIHEPVRPALVHAVRQHPSVGAVAASWPGPMDKGAVVEANSGDTKLGVGAKLVTPEYFDLLGISLLRGRLFTPQERSTGAGVVVLSDAVAQKFWPRGNALGQTIRLDGGSNAVTKIDGVAQIPSQVFTVVGVVKDVQSALKMFDFNYSGVYLPTTSEQAKASLVLRVHGDPDTARRKLLDTLTLVDPALGDITTMKTMARLETAVLKVAFWIAAFLGGLALALTVSGLFSVLSYLVEQRKTEIGVRMALGATPRDIVELVLSQSMRPIAIGVVAGGVLAAALTKVLLAIPEAASFGVSMHAYDPMAYAGSLGVIVATCLVAALLPARRAARMNPNTTLRAD